MRRFQEQLQALNSSGTRDLRASTLQMLCSILPCTRVMVESITATQREQGWLVLGIVKLQKCTLYLCIAMIECSSFTQFASCFLTSNVNI